MPVVDTLITRYEADQSQYDGETKKILARTKEIHDAQQKALKSVQSSNATFASNVTAVGSAIATVAAIGIGAATALVGAMVTITTEMGKMGLEASKAAGDFEALLQALAAVTGGMENAVQKAKELRKIAAAPGIGPIEATQGYTQLRRSGLEDEFSKKLLVELANQNALTGGGKDEFGRLMLAIAQISTEPNPGGQELRQLQQGGIPVYKMIQDMYGLDKPEDLAGKGITSAQFLNDLVKQMAKTARVGDSAKNTFENLETAIDMMKVSVGQGINQTLVPAIKSFGESLDMFDKGGAFKMLGEKIASDFEMLIEALTGDASIDDAIATILASVDVLSEGVRNFWINLKEIAESIGNFLKTDLPNLLGNIPFVGGALKGTAQVAFGGIESLGGDFAQKRTKYLMAGELGRKRAEKEAMSIADYNQMKKDDAAKSASKQNQILQEIATNTRPILDMRRMALGGGDMARLGVTPVEVSGMRNANRYLKQIQQAFIGLQSQAMNDALRLRRT